MVKELGAWFTFFIFWGFIAVKLCGTSFAAWSWWWVLCPIMPWMGLAVVRLGL